VLSGAKFSTRGKSNLALRKNNEHLEMNGRAVFNFALQDVPQQITATLQHHDLNMNEIELFLLHQGSQFMLENIIKRAGVPPLKAPIKLSEMGNTVSSSIPLLWEAELEHKPKIVLISGFGVGLSWATAIYKLSSQSEH
jgi:3-oxoacyl-[acyl-carrier-protein] synthase-3